MIDDWAEWLGLEVNGAVFLPSTTLILGVVIFGAFFTETARSVFRTVQSVLVTTGGWFYTLAVAAFLLFILGLLVSPYARIKLGPDDAEPDYSYPSWFAMLFSAGMGIGLLFYSVAEPVLHYLEPRGTTGETIEAARQSLRLTLFHWGLHAWAVYIVVGLSLAYFAYRRDLPLTLRSALYPLIGDRIYGKVGDAVDTFAVIGTMFGIATSLGLGVMQVNAGLHDLSGLPIGTEVQLLLIAIITALATLTVVLGLDRGMRRLSEMNLGLSVILMVFVFLAGPTVFLLNMIVENLGGYFQHIVSMTFRTYPFQDGEWKSNWTLFYWSWWIAWSPFVGMFIARISWGRTIREFIAGVLLVPAGVTLLWFTTFGGTAIHLAMAGPGGDIVQAAQNSIPTALFALLRHFPGAVISSGVATVVVITFFVTSAVSGSIVMDILTAGGRTDAPLKQRVFWTVAGGAVAAVLLVAGGLNALRTATITTALPFAVILLVACYGVARGLQADQVPDSHPAYASPEE